MQSKVDPTTPADCAEQHERRDDELGLKQDLIGRTPERSHRCHLQIVSQGIPGQPKVAHPLARSQQYSNILIIVIIIIIIIMTMTITILITNDNDNDSK